MQGILAALRCFVPNRFPVRFRRRPWDLHLEAGAIVNRSGCKMNWVWRCCLISFQRVVGFLLDFQSWKALQTIAHQGLIVRAPCRLESWWRCYLGPEVQHLRVYLGCHSCCPTVSWCVCSLACRLTFSMSLALFACLSSVAPPFLSTLILVSSKRLAHDATRLCPRVTLQVTDLCRTPIDGFALL
jgi:hypothetical protein